MCGGAQGWSGVLNNFIRQYLLLVAETVLEETCLHHESLHQLDTHTVTTNLLHTPTEPLAQMRKGVDGDGVCYQAHMFILTTDHEKTRILIRKVAEDARF